jgi:hypothetical protein
MTVVLSTALWEIPLVLLSIFVLSAVSVAAMIIFIKGTMLLRWKQYRAPLEEIHTPEHKEP